MRGDSSKLGDRAQVFSSFILILALNCYGKIDNKVRKIHHLARFPLNRQARAIQLLPTIHRSYCLLFALSIKHELQLANRRKADTKEAAIMAASLLLVSSPRRPDTNSVLHRSCKNS